MNAMASLHSSSLKTVSGADCDPRLTVGPPDSLSADDPCPNGEHYTALICLSLYSALQLKQKQYK